MFDSTQSRLDQEPKMIRIRRQTVDYPVGMLNAQMGATTYFLAKTLDRVSPERSQVVFCRS